MLFWSFDRSLLGRRFDVISLRRQRLTLFFLPAVFSWFIRLNLNIFTNRSIFYFRARLIALDTTDSIDSMLQPSIELPFLLLLNQLLQRRPPFNPCILIKCIQTFIVILIRKLIGLIKKFVYLRDTWTHLCYLILIGTDRYKNAGNSSVLKYVYFYIVELEFMQSLVIEKMDEF